MALTLIGASAAVGDDISNGLDGDIDAVAEVMPLNVGGPNGSTTLYVSPANGDGKNGCNLTGGTTLVVAVASSNTSAATVSPSSVTFDACGDTEILTVTPVAIGNATISVTQTSNNTAGSFNFAPATFTVNVAPAANSAPTIEVAGVEEGSSYDKGSVPAATCEVFDVEDGPSSFAATLSAITGDYASDGIGSQSASCSYTDGGGLTASASETYSIIDPSAPAIAYTLSPTSPDGANGWYRSVVTLAWDVADPESPNSLSKTGCDDQTITADQAATGYSCSATSAGGSAGPETVTVKRDATAPAVKYSSATGAQGDNGWYTSAVTATFTATDALSGPASATKTATSATNAEGSAVLIESPAFSDAAGNTATAGIASQSFQIDLSDPTATFDSTIGNVYFGQVPPAPTCTVTDAISGGASCAVSGYSTAVGTHTLTATAKDHAGRTSTATQAYTVLAWTLNGFYQPVDMTPPGSAPVFNTVKNGSTVPLKFEVFSGPTELTSTSAVKSFTATTVSCSTASGTDEIEVTSTGGTSLRYDSTGGQFIQNWQTPKSASTCYRVTMTTHDLSNIIAFFKLR